MRYGHAFAYDSARDVVVLFGGIDVHGQVADTQEWDGTRWRFRASPTPAATLTVPIPFDPALRATTLHCQGFVADPRSPRAGRAERRVAVADRRLSSSR